MKQAPSIIKSSDHYTNPFSHFTLGPNVIPGDSSIPQRDGEHDWRVLAAADDAVTVAAPGLHLWPAELPHQHQEEPQHWLRAPSCTYTYTYFYFVTVRKILLSYLDSLVETSVP